MTPFLIFGNIYTAIGVIVAVVMGAKFVRKGDLTWGDALSYILAWPVLIVDLWDRTEMNHRLNILIGLMGVAVCVLALWWMGQL